MEDQIAMIQKGEIHFDWEGGKKVTIGCTVEEGVIVHHDQVSMIGLGELKGVEVHYGNEEISLLCMECQTHLMHTVMKECPEGSGCLEEVEECSNPDCPNKA